MPTPLPLYEQIKRTLGAEIAAGRHDPTRPFITQREVCRRFGVSTITASRALNELVAEGLLLRRRGVGTFVAERRAAGRAPAAIACIVHALHGLQGAHLAQLLAGAESACADLGYHLVLLNSCASADGEADALRRAVDANVDGILIYPVEGQRHQDAFDVVRRQGIPLVMVDRYRPDIATDSVTADNFDLGYQLTSRLAARGHERIAMLWGETDCTSVRDRLAGHLQALRDHDMPIRPDLTVLRPYEPLPSAQRRSVLSALLTGTESPTVLACANGYVLATVARDLLAAGLRVPEDIELACMDDAGPYDLLLLAAVEARLPSEAMGRTGVELLAERMRHGAGQQPPPRRIVLPASLVERDGKANGDQETGARDRPPDHVRDRLAMGPR